MEQYERFEMMRNMLVSDTDIKSKMASKGYSEKEINAFFRGQRIVRKKIDSPRPTLPNTTVATTDIIKEIPVSINNTTPVKASNQGIHRFIMMRNMNISEQQIQDKMFKNGYSLTDIKAFFISHPSPSTASPISNNNNDDDLFDNNRNTITPYPQQSQQSPPQFHISTPTSVSPSKSLSTTNHANNIPHNQSIINNNPDITFEPLDLSGFVEILSHTANLSPSMIETKMKSVGFTQVEIHELLNLHHSSSSSSLAAATAISSPARVRTLSVHGSHEENEHSIHDASINNNSTTESKSTNIFIPSLPINTTTTTNNNNNNNNNSINSTTNGSKKTAGEIVSSITGSPPLVLNTLPNFFQKNKLQQPQPPSHTINNNNNNNDMNIRHTTGEFNSNHSNNTSQSDKSIGGYNNDKLHNNDNNHTSSPCNGSQSARASSSSSSSRINNATMITKRTRLKTSTDDTPLSSNTSSRSLRASDSDTSVHELLKNVHLAAMSRTAFKKSVSINNLSPRARTEKLSGVSNGCGSATVSVSDTASVRQSLMSQTSVSICSNNNNDYNIHSNDNRNSNMSIISEYSTIANKHKIRINPNKSMPTEAVVDVEDAYAHFVCEAYGTRTDTIKRH